MDTQRGEQNAVRFFVATNSLQMSTNNQIHLVEFIEDKFQLRTKVFEHKSGDIWNLNANPQDRCEIAICYNQVNHHNQVKSCGALCLYDDDCDEMDDDNENENDNNNDNNSFTVNDNNVEQSKDEINVEKEPKDNFNTPDNKCKKQIKKTNKIWKRVEVLNTEGYGTKMRTIEFHPNEQNYLAYLIDNKIVLYNRNKGVVQQTAATAPSAKHINPLNGGKWSYHQQGQIFIALHDNHIKAYDIREKDIGAWSIEDAHSQYVRSIDCNPNKSYHFVSGGDDGFIKIWDCRKCKKPVFARNDHVHWVWCVRFNTFHDQLLLSSSSDGKVLLTSAGTVSSDYEELQKRKESYFKGSQMLLSNRVTDYNKLLYNELLEVYNYHDDSVYCVEWSNADPWIFGSLSYDGRLLITKIPEEYKQQLIF